MTLRQKYVFFTTLMIISLPFTSQSFGKPEAHPTSETLRITSVKAILSETGKFPDQIELQVTGKVNHSPHRSITRTTPGIMLVQGPGTSETQIFALTFWRDSSLVACKSLNDREIDNCQILSSIDQEGNVDFSNLSARYIKITKTAAEKVLCGLLPLCDGRNFDFISLEIEK